MLCILYQNTARLLFSASNLKISLSGTNKPGSEDGPIDSEQQLSSPGIVTLDLRSAEFLPQFLSKIRNNQISLEQIFTAKIRPETREQRQGFVVFLFIGAVKRLKYQYQLNNC